MQSQQPTPSNTTGGHTGAGETHRDRKVFIVDNRWCISSFFSIYDVDILVQELFWKFHVLFSTAIEADLVMEGVADQMVYQLLDLVKMQDL